VIINDEIVFIHLQKCGGTFIKHMMEQNMNAVNIRPEHNGFKDMHPRDKDKLIVGTIRNPYAWYVSLYHSHLPEADVSFFSEVFKGTNSFAEWVKKFLNTNHVVYHDLNFSAMSRLDVGPYTYRMLRCYTDELRSNSNSKSEDISLGNIEILKTDDLANNFVSLIEEKIGIAAEARKKILSSSKIHTSKHGHYSEYYDREAYDLVSHKDRIIFEMFKYEYE
jgi:hypothetical protein